MHWRGNGGRTGLRGISASAPALGSHSTRADAFELGSKFFSIAVIALPGVIVGGIVIAYMLFVS